MQVSAVTQRGAGINPGHCAFRRLNAIVLSTVHSARHSNGHGVPGRRGRGLPHPSGQDIEEERRVAYVGMARSPCQLGLTHAAGRYGEKSRPSPFPFEIGGREQGLFIWTGPQSNGADERLPLPSESGQRQLIRIASTPRSGRKNPPTPRASGNPGQLMGRPRTRLICGIIVPGWA